MQKYLFGLIAVVVLFCMSVYAVGSLLSHPSRITISVPESLHAESVVIPSSSGSDLHGSWITGSADKPTLILMHGVHSDRRSLFRRAAYFKQEGHSVLLFDFQAHGESYGQHITFGFLESKDARAALAFAKARRPSAAIGVIGQSLGGASALIGDSPLECDALVLESVYPDIRAAIDNRIRRWLGPVSKLLTPLFIWQLNLRLGIEESDLRPIDRISNFKKPILILSGSADPHTTVQDTNSLLAAANDPKQLVFFEGARHQDLYDYDSKKYESEIGAFFKKYLPGF